MLPRWMKPVGLGAKRVRTCVVIGVLLDGGMRSRFRAAGCRFAATGFKATLSGAGQTAQPVRGVRTMRRRFGVARAFDEPGFARRTAEQNETELYSPPGFNRRGRFELLYDVRAIFRMNTRRTAESGCFAPMSRIARSAAPLENLLKSSPPRLSRRAFSVAAASAVLAACTTTGSSVVNNSTPTAATSPPPLKTEPPRQLRVGTRARRRRRARLRAYRRDQGARGA